VQKNFSIKTDARCAIRRSIVVGGDITIIITMRGFTFATVTVAAVVAVVVAATMAVTVTAAVAVAETVAVTVTAAVVAVAAVMEAMMGVVAAAAAVASIVDISSISCRLNKQCVNWICGSDHMITAMN